MRGLHKSHVGCICTCARAHLLRTMVPPRPLVHRRSRRHTGNIVEVSEKWIETFISMVKSRQDWWLLVLVKNVACFYENNTKPAHTRWFRPNTNARGGLISAPPLRSRKLRRLEKNGKRRLVDWEKHYKKHSDNFSLKSKLRSPEVIKGKIFPNFRITWHCFILCALSRFL